MDLGLSIRDFKPFPTTIKEICLYLLINQQNKKKSKNKSIFISTPAGST
jgi:hypothetical protein